ncbi:MAG: hypothetical protein GY861_24950 [bacterium]|nr:hypothetical protein [bacterium]
MSNKLEITLGNLRYLAINLTEPLKEGTEVYPGDPKPEKKVFSDIKESGCQHHIYSIGDHNFHPHGDAPKHQNPDLQHLGFESFDLGFVFNKALMIDLSDSPESQDFDGIKYIVEIKKEHLEPFADQLSNIGALIIRSGYDRWLESNKKHTIKNLPHLNEEAAKYIASFKNMKVFGTDSLTVDRSGVNVSHKALKEKLIVESLVHIYEIPPEMEFDLMSHPVSIEGSTGGPIVAYAFIPL